MACFCWYSRKKHCVNYSIGTHTSAPQLPSCSSFTYLWLPLMHTNLPFSSTPSFPSSAPSSLTGSSLRCVLNGQVPSPLHIPHVLHLQNSTILNCVRFQSLQKMLDSSVCMCRTRSSLWMGTHNWQHNCSHRSTLSCRHVTICKQSNQMWDQLKYSPEKRGRGHRGHGFTHSMVGCGHGDHVTNLTTPCRTRIWSLKAWHNTSCKLHVHVCLGCFWQISASFVWVWLWKKPIGDALVTATSLIQGTAGLRSTWWCWNPPSSCGHAFPATWNHRGSWGFGVHGSPSFSSNLYWSCSSMTRHFAFAHK